MKSLREVTHAALDSDLGSEMEERSTGGSCRFFACDASRGPTTCDREHDYMPPGQE